MNWWQQVLAIALGIPLALLLCIGLALGLPALWTWGSKARQRWKLERRREAHWERMMGRLTRGETKLSEEWRRKRDSGLWD